MLTATGMLDLASQPYARNDVDDISVAGFVRSRPYRTGALAQDLGGYVFRATSGASHEISATTVRNVMRYWIQAPTPFLRIASTNLHEAIVAPLCKEIERLGGSIHTDQAVAGIELESGIARRIRIRAASGEVRREAVDQLVLTIPPASCWSCSTRISSPPALGCRIWPTCGPRRWPR